MAPTNSAARKGKTSKDASSTSGASKSRSTAAAKTKPKSSTIVNGRIQKPKKKVKKAAPEPSNRKITLERPLPMHHRIEALLASRWPGRKPASGAYDNKVTKRHPYDHPADLLDMPWNKRSEIRCDRWGHKIERPGFTLRDLHGDSLDAGPGPHDPHDRPGRGPGGGGGGGGAPAAAAAPPAATAHSLGYFGRLPVELRERIFRVLLVHPHGEMLVLQGWTLVYPRRRPRLATGVLRVCRAFHGEGARVLYGANRFVYQLRDPPRPGRGPRPGDAAIVERHIYGQERIPLHRHGQHLRHVRVVVEANRMRLFDSRQNLPAALELLRPDHGVIRPNRLMTITLELPVQTRRQLNMMGSRNDRVSRERRNDVPVASWFERGSSVLQILEELRCQFLRIIAHDCAGDHYEAVIDRRPHFSQHLENSGSGYNMWKDDQMMLEARRNAANQSQARLHTMGFWLRMLVHDPNYAVIQGPFQFYTPEAENEGPLEALPSGSSTRSSRQSGRRRAPMNFRLRDYLPDLDDDDDLDWQDDDDETESLYAGDISDEDYEETRVARNRKRKTTTRYRRRGA
jgi:hypothetical protein